MLFPVSENGFESGLLFEDGLSFLGVVPEVWLGRDLV